MTEAEKFEYRMQFVARAVLLHEENERLKKRLKKKTKMEKHWHKSFMDLYMATTTKPTTYKVKAQELKVRAG